MLHIDKSEPSRKAVKEISCVKREYKYLLEDITPESARDAFDHLDKKTIRDSLVKEQHGICAYCMRRIDSNIHMTIEHWSSIKVDPDRCLDYGNMLGVCNGGRDAGNTNPSVSRCILCCDASKGDMEITISPLNSEHMKLIRYSSEGRIYTYPEDEDLDKDINEVLNLNAIMLIEGRKEAYRSYVKFMEIQKKRKRPIRSTIEKEIERLEGETTYGEFVGVVLYFLKKRLRRV